MHHRSRRGLIAGIGIVTGALMLGVSGLTAPAFAQTGPVSTTPAAGTPELEWGTGAPFEQINVMKQCGNTIYAGGTFATILQNGAQISRTDLFSFSATAPYTVTGWDPDISGTGANVQTLAFDGANCNDIYVGGTFTSINGTPVQNIAEVTTSTTGPGQVVSQFTHTGTNGPVNTMVVDGSHILTGGGFTEINGSSADPYYTSLNVSSGNNDGFLDLHISGNYQYSGVDPNTTRIYNQQMSHSGARVMVEGDFTSVGGQPRQQIFQIWLQSPSNRALVTGWHANVFNTHCVVNEPYYVQAAAWSPTDNTVYVATTGNHVYNWPTTKFPLPPPCDAAMALSANELSVGLTWINQTGCDSLLSVISDGYAVYFAGHERWSQNPDGCNNAGPGAITDYGMEGLNPTTGKDMLNSSGGPMYTMDRANGQWMMLTPAGLWIGSTNRFETNACQGAGDHAGICFLPYS